MSALSSASSRGVVRRLAKRWLRPGAVVATLVVAAALIGACSSGDDDVPEGETHEYTIPAGTGDRIEAGEDVEIVPSRIVMHVGDRFVVHNEDDREHVVGPYVVGEGETLEQQYTSPGLLRGLCTVHQSRELEIIVLGPEETVPDGA